MPKMKALSVDDSELKLMLIENLAHELNIDITSYTDPVKALEYTEKHEFDILFLDYMMPILNGIEFAKRFRENNKSTPIVMITAEKNDGNLLINALQAGVSDFLTFPFNSAEFTARVNNLLNMRILQKRLEKKSHILEMEVLKATKRVIERERETLMVLAKASEFKDFDTELHTERVAKFSNLLAKLMNFPEKDQEIIYYSSPLHDIGKIGIPENVLLKKGKLTNEEFQQMKTHTLIGYKILESTRSEYLVAGKFIALSHHERFDGMGYPFGKKGDDIPIMARIVTITDVFDALLSARPYKTGWPFDDVIEYFKSERGKQFDPVLLDVFLKNKNMFEQIFEENKI